MAEKRFYKMTGRGSESYYAGHGLDKIRLDAAKDAGTFPSEIKHQTMKAGEFYEELEKAEAQKKVVPGKVKGVGQKWVVEPDEEADDDSDVVKEKYGVGEHPADETTDDLMFPGGKYLAESQDVDKDYDY